MTGQPVEIAASGAVVGAMIDYIYGGEPDITTADAMELLRLAGAYGLMDLVAEIERELQDSLNSGTALEVLQQIHTLGLTLTDLRQACEEEIAKDFNRCWCMNSFCDLNAPQLARLLSRAHLWVSREEVVVKALFKWVHSDPERSSKLGMLLQHIDFPSLSMKNLESLSVYAQSLGQNGIELQYSVEEAKHRRGKGWQWQQEHVPKRAGLQFWSQELGAFPKNYRAGRWVAGDYPEPPEDPNDAPRVAANNFCWHQGNLYIADGKKLTRWSPGVSRAAEIVVSPVRDSTVAVSPSGQIFLADAQHHKLMTLRDGKLQEVLHFPGLRSVSVTTTGTVYLLGDAQGRRSLWIPAFGQNTTLVRIFVLGEILYILGWQTEGGEDFVVKVDPDGTTTTVGRGYDARSHLCGLFVTDSGKIYCADAGVGRILTFNPGDRNGLRVIDNAPRFWNDKPVDVICRDDTLYVLYESGLVYSYELPKVLEMDDLEPPESLTSQPRQSTVAAVFCLRPQPEIGTRFTWVGFSCFCTWLNMIQYFESFPSYFIAFHTISRGGTRILQLFFSVAPQLDVSW
eukprot:s2288_g10.t1